MKSIRAAVIGTGFIGPAHIEALRRTPGVAVTAIASNEPDRAREIAEQFAIPRTYDSWQAVVDDPGIDVIHNCTPNDLHFAINRAALLAGKHVVSEKPLTLTSRESAELVRLARRQKLVNAIDFNYRFYPLVQQARSMARSGELGDIYLVHGHYLQDWLFFDTDYNWRLESRITGKSRAVADIGSHWCDLAQFITGQKIVRVFADLFTVHKRRKKPRATVETFKGKEGPHAAGGTTMAVDTEDAGTVVLEFDRGARGVVTVSQVSAGRKNREWLEIDGSVKAIAWDQEDPNELWVGHREKPNETIIKDPSLLDPGVRKYAHYPGGHPEGYPDGLKNLIGNVYDAIRSGSYRRAANPDFPTFEDGHREIRIVEAVLESNKRGRWVRVGR